ncbi:DUF3592 domain-containing protein [Deinococcus ficus]|nr:DUF3592 domain-containing protein [Deinococcus ficus]
MQIMVNKRIVVGLGLLLIGLVILVALVQGLREVAASSCWPAVTGTVLTSTVERRASLGDQGEFEGWLFTPRVTYRYEAGGQSHEGGSLSLMEAWSSSEAWAQQQSGHYPAGSSVRVYHSPDGARAVLEPGVKPGLWAWLLLPGAAIIVGTGLLLTRGPQDRGTVRITFWPA